MPEERSSNLPDAASATPGADKCFFITGYGGNENAPRRLVSAKVSYLSRHLIVPVLTECGFSLDRVDENPAPELVPAKMVEGLAHDEMAVAYFDTMAVPDPAVDADRAREHPSLVDVLHANVVGEVLLRLGWDQPVVVIRADGVNFPFDLRDVPAMTLPPWQVSEGEPWVVQWDPARIAEVREQLRDRIQTARGRARQPARIQHVYQQGFLAQAPRIEVGLILRLKHKALDGMTAELRSFRREVIRDHALSRPHPVEARINLARLLHRAMDRYDHPLDVYHGLMIERLRAVAYSEPCRRLCEAMAVVSTQAGQLHAQLIDPEQQITGEQIIAEVERIEAQISLCRSMPLP